MQHSEADSIKENFSEIPVIDFAGFESNSFDAREMADHLREVCHHIGFFIATNHGVSNALVDNTFDFSKKLFDLPLEKKLLIDKKQSRFFRGWEAEGAEYTNNNPDIREQVDLWSENEIRDQEVEPPYLKLLGPNQWFPESVLPGYRQNMRQWFSETEKLADRIMSLLALGLDLPDDYFHSRFGQERMGLTKLIRYPKTPAEQFGVNAHHDTGFITVLAAGQTPGLQILNATNQWISVPVVANAFVINLGEMLQAITGNYYIATPHRVFCNTERYSVGYFHGPSLETELQVVPLKAEYIDAVKNSKRHSSAGFMATPEATERGIEEMSGEQNATTYGEQLWNYFRRSYPENMKQHYPHLY